MPYFEKEVDDCVNDFERWIYVLKHMETIKRLPWVAQNSIFQRLAEISDLGSLSREERMKYDVALRKYRDTLCVMDGAMMRGLEQGRAEGRAEGREEERMSIARNLKAQHIAISVIASCTGLSEEEIEQLS